MGLDIKKEKIDLSGYGYGERPDRSEWDCIDVKIKNKYMYACVWDFITSKDGSVFD